MAYRRLTKAQQKNRNRILAWLDGQPFRENSRDHNPQVPNLSIKRVLDEYIPPDVTGAGQFFTPLEAAKAVILMDNAFHPQPGDLILDPCAGIGHLLYPLQQWSGRVHMDTFELEDECVRIGQRLFPWANWHCQIPFSVMDSIKGRYDYVICNPPFGIQRGMSAGDRMCEGRCHRSEHIFLELCIRALKPKGQAIILAPYNYLTRLPKAAKPWLNANAVLEHSWGPLPGEFALTKMRIHAWYFSRLDTACFHQRTGGRHANGTMTKTETGQG